MPGVFERRGAASGRNDYVVRVEGFGELGALRRPECSLAFGGEDLRDGHAVFGLELGIEVDHVPAKAICENPAGRGLAGATEANEGNTAIGGHGSVVILRTLSQWEARALAANTLPGPDEEVACP
jgi:hypothetical protein